MLEKVKKFIQDLQFSKEKLRIAVSYSGGADSGALLHLMVKLFKDGVISKPSVIYFNHNLRGKESAAEERSVIKVCSGYGIDLKKIDLDVISHAEKTGLTIETAARDLRYEHYRLLSGEFDYIAQGHHADDNAETVFFNILRGAGLDGACGINKVRDYFIRPLLDFSKREILNYAELNNIKYIEDSTNIKTDYSRNKIRNIIFPVIEKELNRNIKISLCNFSASVSEARNFISGSAEKEFSKNVRVFKGSALIRLDSFSSLHPVLKTSILQTALKKTGCIYNPDRIKTEIILKNISNCADSVFKNEMFSISIHSNNILIMNSKFENPALISLSGKKVSQYYFDLLKTKGNIRIGKIETDDVFVPFGKKKAGKVSKVLSDKKIPPVLRKHLLCLRDDENIIFIQGAGISDKVKTEAGTSGLMYINLKNDILKKLF
jgi:tRNA(Ile)-lysidine synthase